MRRQTYSPLIGSAMAATVILLASACGTGEGEEQGESGTDSVRMGTAGEGGTYYYLGTAFAQEMRNDLGILADSVATAGGTENLRRVASGDLDLAFSTIDDFMVVMQDEDRTPEEFKLLGTGHLTVQQAVVSSGSGIETIEQLAQPENRLGVGEPGSAVQHNAELILGAYGLTTEDVEAFEVSQSAAAEEMRNGNLDGAIFGGGVPLAAITELMTAGNFEVLEMDQTTIDHWSANTAYVEALIPAGSYDGQDEDITSIGQPTVLVVPSEMDDSMAYDLIRVIQESGQDLEDAHPAATEYTIENAFRDREFIEVEAELNYHQGAIDWYEENDAWEPAN